MPEQSKKRPVHEVRIGPVKATMWRNEGSNGPWHNVTFEPFIGKARSGRAALVFGRDELLVVAKVADIAHTWMFENEARSESRFPPFAIDPKIFRC